MPTRYARLAAGLASVWVYAARHSPLRPLLVCDQRLFYSAFEANDLSLNSLHLIATTEPNTLVPSERLGVNVLSHALNLGVVQTGAIDRRHRGCRKACLGLSDDPVEVCQHRLGP